RHISRRSNEAPLANQLGVRNDDGSRRRAVGHETRDTPIEKVNLPEITKHDVVWLQIAMNHAARVRIIHSEADTHERVEELPARMIAHTRQPIASVCLEHVAERLAAYTTHREKEPSVGGNAKVVDGNDRGVLELSLHPHLAEKTPLREGVGRPRVE